MKDWNEREIECAHSKCGVIVVTHPYDNLIRSGCTSWPPPEIVQKLYQSRQIGAFEKDEAQKCMSGLGFYCDLQSTRSEDAITWSVFGTAARASQSEQRKWLADFFRVIGYSGAKTDEPEIFLWRRLPHPDTLVPGGPEIDVGIITSNALLLVEAKWQAGVGSAQGKNKDKDQIQLRGEFLEKYGRRMFPNRTQFVVVGISLIADAFEDTKRQEVAFRSTTWGKLCSLASHPHAPEVQRYFEWKSRFTKPIR